MLGNRDYGDCEVDLREIMQIIKPVNYKGWINIDLNYARVSPPMGSFARFLGITPLELRVQLQCRAAGQPAE